ncbi:MAG: sensor histidine kinase, partial [Candidatus Obscuribacterales bacterium]
FFRAQSGQENPAEATPSAKSRQNSDNQKRFAKHQAVNEAVTNDHLQQQAEDLSKALSNHASQYIEKLIESHPHLQLRVSEPQRVPEPVNWLPRSEQKTYQNKNGPSFYTRWRVSGGGNILSVRASKGLVEFFVVPDKEVPHITMSEFGSRYRGKFAYVETRGGNSSGSGSGMTWKHEGVKLNAEQTCRFVEHLLDELALGKERPRSKPFPEKIQPSLEKQLEIEKNNLLFKLLNQQEELKNQLARDLHDSVIADLMMLKRYLAGDKKLSPEETIEIVDEVVVQLRDIVNEYSPRQLQEWGLQVGIEDLLERISRRTGLTVDLTFSGELPKYPDLVSLHIFRVIQESLNNIEKHAGASEISVDIKATSHGISIFKVSDNGSGFDSDQVRMEADGSHSMGLEGMRERVELIRCFYQCQISIESQIGQGTTVTLSISQPK